MIIAATSDCKLAAYLVSKDSFELMDPIDKYNGWVIKCELSLDNTFLVVQVEKIIAIYDAKKRFVPLTRFKPHSHTFNDIAWSKCMSTTNEKQMLATCGKDGTIRLWKAKDIISKKLRNEEVAETPYMELGVFQDPTKLYNRPDIDGDGHVESVVCISFDTKDKYLVSGGVDYRLLLWDIQRGRFMHEFHGMSMIIGWPSACNSH